MDRNRDEPEDRAMADGRSRSRYLMMGSVVTGSSLVACLIVAEFLVRLVAPQQLIQFRPDIWQPVDTLGWTFRPHVSGRINSGDGWATIHTDERGFRVGERGAVSADRNVLLLGDSFMAAIQVDFEESMAGLMEKDLPELVGEPVAVWNAAVGGWDPPHYLLRARSVLHTHAEALDLVLVGIYLGNDVVDWNTDAFPPRDPFPQPRLRLPQGVSSGEWIDAVARPLDNSFRKRSHLYVMLRHELTTLRMRLGLSTAYFPHEYLVTEATSPRWDNTASILGEIAELAATHCIPTVYFLIPPRYQADPFALARHASAFGVDTSTIRIDQPNELLGERLRARGSQVLDPTPELRKAVREGRRPYGSVDAHFSAEGHAITWRFVHEDVVRALNTPMCE